MEEQKVELKLQVGRKGSRVISYVLRIALHVPLIMEKALQLRIYLLALGKLNQSFSFSIKPSCTLLPF